MSKGKGTRIVPKDRMKIHMKLVGKYCLSCCNELYLTKGEVINVTIPRSLPKTLRMAPKTKQKIPFFHSTQTLKKKFNIALNSKHCAKYDESQVLSKTL